ncbi:MAG TPA: ABC transporter permease [Sediminispirochaeta sp.]|nr:ABC transporter permease [Sediminispirochaeta sp.]
MLAKMALRNIFRYKKRSFITSIAIALGLMFYILMNSLLMGWYGSTEQQYIDYEVASGRIVKKAWWADKDRMPLSESIEETDRITSLLEELGIAYTPRSEFAADLVFYKNPYPEDGVYHGRVLAIDPQRDAELFELADSIHNEHSRGEFLGEGNDGIVVGNALADKLNMEVGYPIRLQFTGKQGFEEVLDTRIIGIVKTGSHLFNLNGIFMSLDTADYYLGMDGAVTSYSIQLPPGGGGEKAMTLLEERLPEEYRIIGYEEIASDFMAMKQMEDSYVSLILFLVFVIAAVGVSNTMMMAIFERRREIGMLRAQGLTEGKIQILFFLEAGGIGAIGTLFGLSLGALLNIPLVNRGLNYAAMMGTNEEFVNFGSLVIDSHMKGIWSLTPFLVGGVMAVLVSSLAAYFPSHRMLRRSIPDNLRID